MNKKRLCLALGPWPGEDEHAEGAGGFIGAGGGSVSALMSAEEQQLISSCKWARSMSLTHGGHLVTHLACISGATWPVADRCACSCRGGGVSPDAPVYSGGGSWTQHWLFFTILFPFTCQWYFICRRCGATLCQSLDVVVVGDF